MRHSTPSTAAGAAPTGKPAVPDGLLDQLRSTAPPASRAVEVARARALLDSGAWFGAGVAEAIAATLLTGDDVA